MHQKVFGSGNKSVFRAQKNSGCSDSPSVIRTARVCQYAVALALFTSAMTMRVSAPKLHFRNDFTMNPQ